MNAMDDAFLWHILDFGDLSPLAQFAKDPALAAALRRAQIGKPQSLDIAIRARLQAKMLKADGWEDSAAIIEAVLLRHWNGNATNRPRATEVVLGKAKHVKKPADALFNAVTSDPKRLALAREALGRKKLRANNSHYPPDTIDA